MFPQLAPRAGRKRLTERGWWKPRRASVTFRSSPEAPSSRLDCLRRQFALHTCAFQKHTAASQTNSDEKSMAAKAWLRVDALKRKGGFHFISVRQRMCLLGAVFLHSFARCVSADLQRRWQPPLCLLCSIGWRKKQKKQQHILRK